MTDHAPLRPPSLRRDRKARRWRSVVFAPVGDGSTRRRASDAVRLGLSVLVVAVAILLVRAGTAVEGDVVDALHPAPTGISWLVSALWFLGSIGAIVVVVGLALLARRFRLARDTALAGVATWLTCGLFVLLLGDDGGRPSDSVVTGVSANFPLARIAVAIAVVSMVAPSLSRPFRRAVLPLVGLAAVAAVLQGSGFPLAVVASLAVGWGVAAAVRLVVESPTGLPAPSAVVDAAAELGVELSDVAPIHPQVWGVAQFTAALDAEPVEVVGLRPGRLRRAAAGQGLALPLVPRLGAHAAADPAAAGRARGLPDPGRPPCRGAGVRRARRRLGALGRRGPAGDRGPARPGARRPSTPSG